MVFFSINNIKNFFSSKDSVKIKRNPDRDWFIIVIFFSVLTAVILIASILFFIGVDQEKVFRTMTSSASSTSLFDHSITEKVGKYYEQQNQQLDILKTQKSDVVDPAL